MKVFLSELCHKMLRRLRIRLCLVSRRTIRERREVKRNDRNRLFAIGRKNSNFMSVYRNIGLLYDVRAIKDKF